MNYMYVKSQEIYNLIKQKKKYLKIVCIIFYVKNSWDNFGKI